MGARMLYSSMSSLIIFSRAHNRGHIGWRSVEKGIGVRDKLIRDNEVGSGIVCQEATRSE